MTDFRAQGLPNTGSERRISSFSHDLSDPAPLWLTFPHHVLPRIHTHSAARIPCFQGEQFQIKSSRGRFWTRSGGNVGHGLIAACTGPAFKTLHVNWVQRAEIPSGSFSSPFSWLFPPDFPSLEQSSSKSHTWVCPHLAPTSEVQDLSVHRVWGKYLMTPCRSQHFQVIPVQQEGAGSRDRLAGHGEQEPRHQITTFLPPHHLFQSRKGTRIQG